MTLDNCINALDKVCESFILYNSGSFLNHLLSELSMFKYDITRRNYSADIENTIVNEMESLGCDQSFEGTSIVSDIGVIDLLFRTRNKKKRLVLIEQKDNLDKQFVIGKTRRLASYIKKHTPSHLLEKYHSESYEIGDKENNCNNNKSSVVDESAINIVWVGKITSKNQIILRDFTDNLLDVFQGVIYIHLPDGLDDDYGVMGTFDDRVKIMPYGRSINEEFREIDLCVTTQDRALLPSILGIPTIIRPDYQTRYRNDRYVYSCDLDIIKHVVNHQTLSEDGVRIQGIRDVIIDIYSQKRDAISCNCKKYAMNTLSLGLELVKYEGMKRSRLFMNRTVRMNYNLYLSYYEETRRSYREYLTDNGIVTDYRTIVENNDWKKEQYYWKRDDYSLDELLDLQSNYKKKVELMRKRKTKIKVAFLVLFKQSFSFEPLFKKMVDDDMFDPYIVAIPNVLRSMVYQNDLYRDTFESLKGRFGDRVIHGYIERLNKYVELGDEYDIIVFTNPYEIYEHPFHNVKYFEKRNVLSIYVNYGFLITKYSDEMISENIFSSVWKYLLETDYHMEYYRTKSIIGGSNAILTGFVKMDDLYKEKKLNDGRITIIIAPHHTVADNPIINLSNFVRYSDFFLELPERYPEVDFIFRPHPLLFVHLKVNKIWNEVKIEDYLRRIDSIPNMVYDNSDYYLDKFANSDAIIHDCGSFMAEYLYTNKPCCYMIKNNEQLTNSLLPFGQGCLDCYYKAFNETDIINFIEEVVINGNDYLKEKRTGFSSDKVMVNYPHSSELFIEYLKAELRS